eukprot:Skav206465  [mRNA]  locus=scaffold2787:16559:20681:- [translate_table: standard]
MISEDAFDCPDQLVNDLLIALRQIPQLLRYLTHREVEEPMKQVLKLAFSEGPAGIQEVLRTNKIDSELEAKICLGIGDRLPDELRANLNYSMNVVFEVGEYVIADIDGAFVVGRVAKWSANDGAPGLAVNDLMRRYRVHVSKGDARILRHSDLYKPRSSSVDQGHSLQFPAGDPPSEDTQVTQDQQVQLEVVKRQLRQMAQMEEAAYKKALRRLFLIWHPDKLKQHEDWYRSGGGDDTWLDDFGVERRPGLKSSKRKGGNAKVWLRQAEHDLKTTLLLKDAEQDSTGSDFSSDAVFHASQTIEKALKSSMLRTCGLAQQEFTGAEAHDLVALHKKLKEAYPETDPQRQGQAKLPGTASDMGWLKHAYLASRYPNANRGEIPALAYSRDDAQRASQLAQQVVQWAKHVEDLPEPRNRPGSVSAAVLEEAEPVTAPAPPRGPVIEELGDAVPAQLESAQTPPRPLEPSIPSAPPLTAGQRQLGHQSQRMLGEG